MTGNDFQELCQSIDSAFDELEYLKDLFDELLGEMDTALDDIGEQISCTDSMLKDCRKALNKMSRKGACRHETADSAPVEEALLPFD